MTNVDDKTETSEVQAERTRQHISRGDSLVALRGRQVQISGQGSACSREDMKNKANGPADCLVTEMLQCLPTETVYEVAHWFVKRFNGECRAPEARQILSRVFLKKPDAKHRPSEAISKWYTTVLVDLLREEKRAD